MRRCLFTFPCCFCFLRRLAGAPSTMHRRIHLACTTAASLHRTPHVPVVRQDPFFANELGQPVAIRGPRNIHQHRTTVLVDLNHILQEPRNRLIYCHRRRPGNETLKDTTKRSLHSFHQLRVDQVRPGDGQLNDIRQFFNDARRVHGQILVWRVWALSRFGNRGGQGTTTTDQQNRCKPPRPFKSGQ